MIKVINWRVLIGVMVTVCLSVPVLWAQNEPLYQGLDILFLVDQSASMSGATGRPPTDPNNLRFEAIQYALDTLSEYRALVPEGSVFRMSVVNFGGRAEVNLPWTEVGQAGDARWESERARLMQMLSADAFQSDNEMSLATDFLAGLEVASAQFAQLPSPTDGQHLRAVVVLTDGAPCIPISTDMGCDDRARQLSYMIDLVSFVETEFVGADYQFFVIAIDDAESYWPDFESYWQQIVGQPERASPVTSSTEVAQRFLVILARLLDSLRTDDDSVIGERVDLANDQAQIIVPPYHQMLRITLFKSQPSGSLEIIDPEGKLLDTSEVKVEVSGSSGLIEVWTVSMPQPGIWQLAAVNSASLVDVYKDLISIDREVVLPTAALNVFFPAVVELRLHDDNGNLLPDYYLPQYALEIAGQLNLPDGSSTSLSFNQVNTGVYQAKFTPTQAGKYTVGVRATSHNVDGTEFVVFDEAAANMFTVSALDVQVDGLPEDNLQASEKVELAVRLLREDGSSLPANNWEVSAVIQDQQGNTWAEFLLNLQDDVYRGGVDMNDIGQYIITLRVLTAEQVAVYETRSDLFSVNPTNFAVLAWQEPVDDAISYTTNGFPPVNPASVRVFVQVRNRESQTPIDLASIAQTAHPLRLTVIDSQTQAISVEVLLEPGEGIGQYQADVTGLAAGEYTLILRAEGELTYGTVWDRESQTQTRTLIRQTNPMLYGFIIVLVVLALSVVGTLIFLLLRRRRRRQHPAKGTLAILREDEYNSLDRHVVWQISLDSFQSNHIVIGKGKLPASLGIKRMVVTCSNVNMSKNRQVRVVVKMADKSARGFSGRQFNPGSQEMLRHDEQGTYYLVKDHEAF